MSSTTAATNRSTKIKAMLAGGLVLGIGAAVTLASWTDQAYVNAEFGTSEFNIQVQTTEEGWVEAETETDASTLAFAVDFAGALQPGHTVYAPLLLKTDDSSVGGEVTLGAATEIASTVEGSTAGELFAALSYSVSQIPDGATCDVATIGAGEPLVTNAPLTEGSDTAVTLGARGDDPANLCFAVTLPAENNGRELQNLDTAALWKLDAVSTDA